MHIETVNILVGAGIALVSSILTAIVTYIFQSHSDKQKREWILDDYS